MPEIQHPFADEVTRNGLSAEAKAEHIRHLRRKNRHGNTAGKSDYHRIRNELDDSSELEYAEQNQQHAGNDGRDRKSADAILLDHAIDNDDECSGRAADLNLASSQE